ncbi:molybdenum cofactor guanylyltransferase MobA [Nitratireductor sp. StC3]|uniref:molybdenum cofactor guanylyltransferase MobA n=1 Tax=Nitratireductor sp. StC3 TaxID=2126741 RepID=UPI000D0CAC28|nr:molybdenum cofactor guanylyltransferase MobA [Nitratireductor sp. StC3]PSM20067.1 molybdenum cofactor guanylyltransferase MobA [Nitratireductor sp. StC3]
MERRLAGLVLAGGRSSRMAGSDKAFLTLAGKPLIAHVLERLAPAVEAVAVSANLDPQRFSAFGRPVIGDIVAGQRGPLAGIHAGLVWAASAGFDRLVTTATDTPFFPPDLVARLAAAGHPQRIALAASRGRTHPVFGLWPTVLADEMAAFLNGPEKPSVSGFCRSRSIDIVEFAVQKRNGAEIDPFFNINTPGDLAIAERLIADEAQ